MAESLKQKLGFVVAAMMMVAALGVLNLGTPADAQSKRCKPDGGGNQTASPSPTESEEPFPPELPPVIPGDDESESPSPTPTTGRARNCDSGISLNYNGPNRKNPERREFAGRVSSQEDECKVGRKVILKKKKKGRDRTIEATVTRKKGSFRMPVKRANGVYYAKTPRERVAADDGPVICGAAKSNFVKV